MRSRKQSGLVHLGQVEEGKFISNAQLMGDPVGAEPSTVRKDYKDRFPNVADPRGLSCIKTLFQFSYPLREPERL